MATIATVGSDEFTRTIENLRVLQRRKTSYLKSRIRVENNIRSCIATSFGFEASIEDQKERKRLFVKAQRFIDEARNGGISSFTDNDIIGNVGNDINSLGELASCVGVSIDGIDFQVRALNKLMEKRVKCLPIIKWANNPEQKGLGPLSLATIVGECGDLANYPNPGKLWKRMGCAPYESKGVMRMGSTWQRLESTPDKLKKAEWQEFGYVRRRRAVMYVIGECLIKSNGDGPYRRRYMDVKRQAFFNHPPEDNDPAWKWTPCEKCENGSDKATCIRCVGTGHKCMHAHLHAMLLATKLLLKNLWIAWNPDMVREMKY